MPTMTLIPDSPDDRDGWVSQGIQQTEAHANQGFINPEAVFQDIERVVEVGKVATAPDTLRHANQSARMGFITVQRTLPHFN